MSGPSFPRLFGKFSLLRRSEAAATPRPGPEPPTEAAVAEGRRAAVSAYLCAEPFAEQLRVLHVAELPGFYGQAGQGAADDPAVRLLAARQLCELRHPHLLAALEAGRVDDALFVACEYVPGRSLLQVREQLRTLLLRREPAAATRQALPVEAAVYIGRCVASALHALHTHPLGARRMSPLMPAQIALGVLGEVKLDSGLPRRLLLPQSEPPEPGAARYLAPEQSLDAAPSVSADVYALGAILWELLAARPFPRPPVAGAAPDPDSDLAAAPLPEVPEVVASLIGRALMPTPSERFPSAAAMQRALDEALGVLAPGGDAGCVVSLLRALWGDQIAHELDEQAWLLDAAFRGLRPPASGAAAAFSPASRPPASGSPVAGSPVPVTRATPPSSPEARLRRGEIIDGRYRLRRLIGVGGMGAVYEAEHVSISKRVALKILHPQFSRHPELVERLRREAQAASRIGHPNIVDVSDFGRTEDGSSYLAMEYLSGTDLGAILRRPGSGRLPEERALHIAVQLVRALGAAHRASVIHRDLKPENIFLVDPLEAAELGLDEAPADGVPTQGQDLVKVLDFGVAMQLDAAGPSGGGAARLTTPGLTVGTPEYMAPEQAMGLAVDARVDIYAVGALLYEMLTGRVPLAAATVPELLRLKTTSDPPAPRHWLPSLSPQVEAVVMACLRRDPLTRPQTMEELELALQQAAAALGVELDPSLSGAARASARSGRLRQPLSTLRPMPALFPLSPPRVAEPVLPTPDATAAASADATVVFTREPPAPAPASSESPAPPAFEARPVGWTPGRSRRIAVAALVLIGSGFLGASLLSRRQKPASVASSSSVPIAAPVAAPAPPVPSRGVAASPPAPPGAESRNPPEPAPPPAAGEPVDPPAAPARADERAALVERARAALVAKRPLEALSLLRALEPARPPGSSSSGADGDTQRAVGFPRAELAKALLAQARKLPKRGGRPVPHEALALLRGAVEADPSSVAAHLLLADALRRSGQREEALLMYRRGLVLTEAHRGAHRPERRTAERVLRRLADARPQRRSG